MADVWFVPYLPLGEQATFGPWTLVPFMGITRKHATTVGVYNEVRRLRTAYRATKGLTPLGAVVLPHDGRIGEDFSRDLLPKTANAIAAAALDSNPKPVAEGEGTNEGHRVISAENVQLVGHPLTGERSYVLRTGAMATTLAFYSAEEGRPLPKIKPPNDLPAPIWFDFDYEFASAVYSAINSETEEGEQVNLAVEWLRLAWDNSSAVSVPSRVLSLRSGFDAILGGESNTKSNRKRLSKLLDPAGAEKLPRTWTDHGNRKSEDLTHLEYWFQLFAVLRNKIAHGDVGDLNADLVFEGHHHVRYAEEILRRAIKRVVVSIVDEPLLEHSAGHRAMVRALEGGLKRSQPLSDPADPESEAPGNVQPGA